LLLASPYHCVIIIAPLELPHPHHHTLALQSPLLHHRSRPLLHSHHRRSPLQLPNCCSAARLPLAAPLQQFPSHHCSCCTITIMQQCCTIVAFHLSFLATKNSQGASPQMDAAPLPLCQLPCSKGPAERCHFPCSCPRLIVAVRCRSRQQGTVRVLVQKWLLQCHHCSNCCTARVWQSDAISPFFCFSCPG